MKYLPAALIAVAILLAPLVWNVSRKIPHKPVAAAIAITGDYMDRAVMLAEAGVDILCVDVAHGHHIMMNTALATLKRTLPDNIHIMNGVWQ